MESIQSLLQKLRPLYPESEQHKLNKIWTLYQTSDWDRKKDLEGFIHKLAASKGLNAVDEQIILPPPHENGAKGDISIGDVTYLDKLLFEYSLKLSELTRQAGMLGSLAPERHACQAYPAWPCQKKVPFIILDCEQSDRAAINETPEIKFSPLSPPPPPRQRNRSLLFNFFKVPAGIDYPEYVKNVIEVLQLFKAYVGGVGSPTRHT